MHTDKKDNVYHEYLFCAAMIHQSNFSIVTEFSKKTGDYGALSAVDLRVLALALSMEREAHGGDISHLRTEPTVRPTVKQHEVADTGSNKLPGFYNPGSESEGEEESANDKVGC